MRQTESSAFGAGAVFPQHVSSHPGHLLSVFDVGESIAHQQEICNKQPLARFVLNPVITLDIAEILRYTSTIFLVI